ncbi:uncharacterized protein LOC130367132 [Hyla sarda]|uniref:uncharacterized protein LOC130367132 n=1 Tax=Hyla sarda TaxID=327740 RepID=UPI0024C33788|nr:uncharacterized protein LOC130367132 [Hyla sarda]
MSAHTAPLPPPAQQDGGAPATTPGGSPQQARRMLPTSPPFQPLNLGAPVAAPVFLGNPVLRTYNRDPFTLRDFKEKIQSLFVLHSFPPNQQVQLLTGQLQGSALEEVRTWPAADKATVEQIFEGLYPVFESHSPSELRLRLSERRQEESALGFKWASPEVEDHTTGVTTTGPEPIGRRAAQHHLKTLQAEQKSVNRQGEICRVRIQDTRSVTLQPQTETIIWCRARPGVKNQDYRAVLEPIQLEDYALVRGV